jgi:hypothetical protein|nr:MAG: hypothetical protein [Caudoviricetes sp.]
MVLSKINNYKDHMYTLIIFLSLTNQIQLPGFTSEVSCQQAFNLISPTILEYIKDNKSPISYYCIQQ